MIDLRINILFLLVSFILTSGYSFANELDEQNILQAKITIMDIYGHKNSNLLAQQELRLGDTFNAIIEVWPRNLIETPTIVFHRMNFVEDYSKELEGQIILGLFYINHIKSIKISSNNEEVILIDANMVLIKNFVEFNFHVLKLANKEIPTFIESNFKIVNDLQDSSSVVFNDFKYVKPQEAQSEILSNKKKVATSIVIILASILIAIYFIRILIVYFKNESLHRSLILHWKGLFEKELVKREDYEIIYKGRNEWIKLTKIYNQKKYKEDIDNFLLKLNSHQYRRNWDQHVYNEVSTAFERIRYIWSDNFNKANN
ncbi:MAG: hypothetical protein HQK49_10485 [Oligoflexia bacterium]|nr:hypothetical protein [Oligoflexia bacterium]